MNARLRFGLPAAVLALVSVGAVLVAARTDPDRLAGRATDPQRLPVGKPAGPLDGATGWINSPPLGSADLAGKVVVYDFWTYSCVNCVRTLPHLRAWHDPLRPGRGRQAAEHRLLRAVPRVTGPLRPFVVGVVSGAAWTPCVGPRLGAALMIAAASGQAVRGSLLLVADAIGIGVPFMLASLGLASSRTARRRLAQTGPAVQRVGGVLLVGFGVLLLTGAYQHLTSYLARFTPSVGGL